MISGVGGVGGIALAYAVAKGIGKITFYSALASHADAGRYSPDHLAKQCVGGDGDSGDCGDDKWNYPGDEGGEPGPD